MDMDRDIDLDLSSQGSPFARRTLPRQPQGDHYSGKNREVMCAMAKVAVDRSDGNLEAFVGAHFITDEILNYIGARLPSLKPLALVSCELVSCDGFTDLVTKCPLLEDIELSGCKHVGGHGMVAAGRTSPRMRRLVLNKPWRRRWDRWDAAGILAMRELRHLRISRSEIRNEELMAVVDGCPFLQHLSVAECPNIVVDDALRAKCATVETLELPASQDLGDLDAYEFGSLSYYVNVDNDWMSDSWWMA
ncbi:hypothetical protein ZWY2020_036160 [Hordeum vulgare]|nr:hypothetical protein ZWY2020_036160 [Hordeum vulgare]